VVGFKVSIPFVDPPPPKKKKKKEEEEEEEERTRERKIRLYTVSVYMEI
jgi:hypothetical protein